MRPLVGRLYWNTTPRHDNLIARLLVEGKLVVYEDWFHPVWDKYGGEDEAGCWQPKTVVLFRNDNYKGGKYMPANFQIDDKHHDGYPVMQVYAEEGSKRRVWLRAHRIVYVAFNGPCKKEVDHIDQDRANYNIWNLRDASRTRQNRNKGGYGLQSELDVVVEEIGFEDIGQEEPGMEDLPLAAGAEGVYIPGPDDPIPEEWPF